MISISNRYNSANDDGWIPVSDTWTYASATTITVPSGAASKYQVGDKLKLTQTTVKYFYIVTVADTTITIYGGDNYTLTNAPISNIFISNVAIPFGFPEWFSFTPSFTNITKGTGGTFVFRLRLIGKTCVIQGIFTFGTGSSMGTAPSFTLPISALNTNAIPQASIEDTGTTTFTGVCIWSSTASFEIAVINTSSTYANASTITSTVPMTWTTNDKLRVNLSYEMA